MIVCQTLLPPLPMGDTSETYESGNKKCDNCFHKISILFL